MRGYDHFKFEQYKLWCKNHHKKPSSYKGKLYWFNGKLYCKDCLIQELLKEKVIYDNWYSNF